MYGTIARFKVKAGMEQTMHDDMKKYEALKIRGHRNTYVYKMENEPNVFYMTVIFDDKQSYTANADSPDQDKRYQEFLAYLDGEPEWHDGEIVYNM